MPIYAFAGLGRLAEGCGLPGEAPGAGASATAGATTDASAAQFAAQFAAAQFAGGAQLPGAGGGAPAGAEPAAAGPEGPERAKEQRTARGATHAAGVSDTLSEPFRGARWPWRLPRRPFMLAFCGRLELRGAGEVAEGVLQRLRHRGGGRSRPFRSQIDTKMGPTWCRRLDPGLFSNRFKG